MTAVVGVVYSVTVHWGKSDREQSFMCHVGFPSVGAVVSIRVSIVGSIVVSIVVSIVGSG